jgi:uncharacterized glyoxalase superfamily protein PhnB
MKVTDLKPMLCTEDLKGTIDFYVDTLGFTCDAYNDEWGWASIRKDDVAMMLSKPNEHTPYDKIGFTGSFYFSTDDVDTLWEKLKDKAQVCYGIEDFFYGMREFAVYDNNGYLLQFGQEIEAGGEQFWN